MMNTMGGGDDLPDLDGADEVRIILSIHFIQAMYSRAGPTYHLADGIS